MPIIYKPRTRYNATNGIQSAITVADPPSGYGGQPHTMASRHYQSHSCVPVVCTILMFRVILCMSPLEKVPFATFYPPLEVPVWHIFFKKRLFQVDSCIQFYRLMQLIFSTSFKGIIRKECQSFTNHGHAKTPPTVFNPLSLWLTLLRDMGGQPHTMASRHYQSHSCVPVVCTILMFRVILCMNPLEKVLFATFYPRWKYLCGTYFSKKDFFKWTHVFNFIG